MFIQDVQHREAVEALRMRIDIRSYEPSAACPMTDRQHADDTPLLGRLKSEETRRYPQQYRIHKGCDTLSERGTTADMGPSERLTLLMMVVVSYRCIGIRHLLDV